MKMNHGHSVTKIVSWSNITLSHPWLSMAKDGPTLDCDKDCLNMKINHGQPWSTNVECHIVA